MSERGEGQTNWIRTILNIFNPNREPRQGMGTEGSALPPSQPGHSLTGEPTVGEGLNIKPTVESGASGGSKINEPLPPKQP